VKRPGLYCAAGLLAGLLVVTPAGAEWSDHHSRQSYGNNSASTTLKYGGTYGQAGQNYINNRDNWAVPGGGTGAGRPAPMTPAQQAEYNRLMRNTDRMLNNIYNHPHHFGPQPGGQMNPQQRYEYERTIQQSDDLMRRIENDPLLK